MVREAQDLKAVAITDGPKMQLTPVLAPARPTSNLIHGSIDALCPATCCGKEIRPHSRWLPVRDLLGMGKIANVENAQACVLKTASQHPRIVGIVSDTCFFTVVSRPRYGRQVRSGRRSGEIRRRLSQ